MDARLHQLVTDCLTKLKSHLSKSRLKLEPVLFEELIYRKTPTIIIYDQVMIHYKGGSRPWQVDQIDVADDDVRHIHQHGTCDSSASAITAALAIIKGKKIRQSIK